MFISIAQYISMWLLLSFFMTPIKKNPKAFILADIKYLFGFLFFVFIGSFRDVLTNHSLDGYAYYEIFQMANTSLYEYLAVSNVEPLYALLNWIVYNTVGSYYVVLVLLYSVIYICNLYFINYFKGERGINGISLFICLTMFDSFYLQRNSLSVSIFLVMILFLNDKQYIKAFIFSCLSVLSHFSAIIVFIILLAHLLLSSPRDYSDMRLILWIVFLAILGFVLLFAVRLFMASSDKYWVYANSEKGSVAIATTFFSSICLGLFFHNYRKTTYSPSSSTTFGIALSCHFFGFILQLGVSIFYRFILFFRPIIFVELVLLYNTEESNKVLSYRYLCFIVALILMLYSVYGFIGSLQYMGLPYRFFWSVN